MDAIIEQARQVWEGQIVSLFLPGCNLHKLIWPL